MATVYRRGLKDVHRGTRLSNGEVETVTACNFDSGPDDEWYDDKPAGSECGVCFVDWVVAVPADSDSPSRKRRRSAKKHIAIGGGAGALTLIGSLLASQGGGPVPVATVSPTFHETGAAILLPSPHIPEPSRGVTAVPSPRWVPPATAAPSPPPTRQPSPTPCPHPGRHLGADPCTWGKLH